MKPFMAVGLSMLVFSFVACSKKSSVTPPPNTPSDQKITFTAGANAATVSGITIDTSRDVGYEYPFLIIRGIASIAATKDSLTFELQLFNNNNSWASVKQFIGIFNDTTKVHHGSTLNLNSFINDNAYQDAGNGFNDFSTTIVTNDGKTVTGTFSGSLVTIANNTGAPPTLPVTNGTFSIDLPGK